MDSHKIIVKEVKRDGCPEIFELLRKGICQSGKSTHLHTHGQVLTLNMARRYTLLDRITYQGLGKDADYTRRRVAMSALLLSFCVCLMDLSVVYVFAKDHINGIKVGLKSITGQLEAGSYAVA